VTLLRTWTRCQPGKFADVRAKVAVLVSVSAFLAASGAVATAEPPALAGTHEAGARLEGQRLADFVVGPWEVDPALTGMFERGAVVIDGPEALTAELPAEFGEIGMRHNVIDGFSSSRESPDKYLRNVVLRFADPATAGTAATEYSAVAADRTVPAGPVRPAVVPGHPEAAAVSNPADDSDGRRVTYVRAFTAHGPYVLYQLAMAVSGAEEAVALVAGTLDRQAPLIDQFSPTPPALLAGLPADPTGLLAKSLAVAGADVTAERPGVFAPRAALHFQEKPQLTAEAFAAAGMSNWVNGGVGVYETRDPAGARQLADAFAAESDQLGGLPADAVPEAQWSHCATFDFPDNPELSSYCIAVADRFVIETQGPALDVSRQKVAAQQKLLAGG
jgi:hypothetical protein